MPSISDPQLVLQPQRAPVVPRARRMPDGEVLPLERIVMQFVRHRETGVIHLAGGPGSGKTTALRHLLAVLPREARVLVFDQEAPRQLNRLARERVIVVGTEQPTWSMGVAHVQLVPWCEDDLIEYLLAAHPQQCKSILARVRDDADDAPRLDGSPLLWRSALDEFAADESLRFIASALRRRAFALLEEHRCTSAALIWCLKRAQAQQMFFELPEAVRPLLAQPLVQVLVGAERLADLLSEGRLRDELEDLSPDLMRETALLARARPTAQQRLHALVHAEGDSVPAAVSILAAIDPAWRPSILQINLSRAVLDRVRWAGVDLTAANVTRASFARANLAGASFYGATARGADFRGATLRRANLRFLIAPRANFAGADLTLASLGDADLVGADLQNANLEGALCRRTDFTNAKLTGACLAGADLSHTSFENAAVAGADFTGAKLAGARFASSEQVRLADATFDRACLREAQLVRCNLEHFQAEDVDLSCADLTRCLLTGSVLPHASFRDALLRHCGLADIDWEGADLRGADLRGSTFHLGSSRSGLVGSTIPCEGSKTGFYTDELDEQEFKSPAEIRKANLCHADLRGAKVKGVDFYLVDLRSARYTKKQARYFRRCGAILDDPRTRG